MYLFDAHSTVSTVSLSLQARCGKIIIKKCVHLLTKLSKNDNDTYLFIKIVNNYVCLYK